MRRAGLRAESIEPPDEVAGDAELIAALDRPAVARSLALAIIEDRGRGEGSLLLAVDCDGVDRRVQSCPSR